MIIYIHLVIYNNAYAYIYIYIYIYIWLNDIEHFDSVFKSIMPCMAFYDQSL